MLGATGWQSYSALSTNSLTRIPSDRDPIDYLGPQGANGLAAYFGLLKVGRASKGDTVMVSAAAGSVGHFVGQMAKILGCRVVGVCGNDLKCARLTHQLGFDIAVNYKNHSFRKDLKRATPEGDRSLLRQYGQTHFDISIISNECRWANCLLWGGFSL